MQQDSPNNKRDKYSVGGFARNLFDDAWETLKGLYQIVPTIATSGKEVFGDPKGMKMLMDQPGHLGTSLKDTIIAVKNAILEPYQKHGVKVVYHRPLTVALDIATILSLGGGSIAKAGKIANITKLERAGHTIANLPGTVTRKVIDKGAAKVGIDLPAKRGYLDVKREEISQVPIRIKADMETVGKKVDLLSDEEAALWHKARTLGASKAELAQFPKVADALESYRKLADTWTAELKARGLMNDERAFNALVKKYMDEAPGVSRDKAIDLINRAEIKPIYGPAKFESGAFDDFLDVKTGRGKVGFLETFKTAKGSITDPRKYVPMAIKSFREVEGKLRLVERVLQNPEWVKTAGAGEVLRSDIMPEGIMRKYFEENVRAKGVKQAELTRELGKEQMASKLAAGDPELLRRIDEASTVIANKTIIKLLKSEFTRSTSGLLRVYDWMLNLFRKMATIYNPKWYLGNPVGDAIFFELAGGSRRAGELLKRKVMPPQILGGGMAHTPTGMGGYIERFSELGNYADEATRAGIATAHLEKIIKRLGYSGEQAFAKLEEVLRSTEQFSEIQVRQQLIQERIARTSGEIRQIDSEIASLHQKQLTPEIQQKIVNLDTMRGNLLRDMTDDFMKSAKAEERIPGLKAQNDLVRDAVARQNAFVGDYIGLTGFEQGVMRRLIPFYPWAKAMTMLAFRLPFLAPVKTFLWHRYSMAMMSMVGDPELPEWVQGYIPVFARQNGDQVWIKLTGFSPFSGLRTTEVADVPVPAIAAVHEQNPFIGLAMRYVGGRTIFDKSSIPYGEPMVNIGNGDVYEFTEDGKIKKTIPQTPLVSGLVHSFPSVQLLQDLLAPYTVNKYNWVGWPEPVYNPDGTVKYPRELWQRLSSLVVPSMVRSRESLIQGEKARVRQVINTWRKAYRRAGPEERKLIKETLQDYARGEYRRMAQ